MYAAEVKVADFEVPTSKEVVPMNNKGLILTVNTNPIGKGENPCHFRQ